MAIRRSHLIGTLGGGLILLAASTVLAGPFTATYTFTGAAGNQASEPVDAQPADATASDITRGAGVTPVLGANSINSSGWTGAATVGATDYYELSITPDGGFEMDLDNLSFTEQRGVSGASAFEIRSSLDAFAAAIFTFDIPDNTANRRHSIDLGSEFDDLTGPVTLRIYGYLGELPGGTWRLGVNTGTSGGTLPANLVLSGDLSPTVEIAWPGAAFLVGIGALVLVVAHSMRRLQQ